MATAGAFDSLVILRPRVDLDRPIASSSFPPRSFLLIRAGELGLASIPQFTGLRVSRCLRKVTVASAAAKLKADQRSGVTCEVKDQEVAADEVPDVTKDTWESHVIQCARPVAVEFWAPWCGPCKVIHPVMAKMSKAYEGRLECYKINTDKCPDLASHYSVRSIPTIMFFKKGEKKDAVIGAVPEATLVSCIDKFLGR